MEGMYRLGKIWNFIIYTVFRKNINKEVMGERQILVMVFMKGYYNNFIRVNMVDKGGWKVSQD